MGFSDLVEAWLSCFHAPGQIVTKEFFMLSLAISSIQRTASKQGIYFAAFNSCANPGFLFENVMLNIKIQ
jgi:hypothetical protein